MMDWQNWLTLALVVVTAFYVYCTYKIFRVNERTVCLIQKQLEESLRPYIVVSTFLVPGNRMLCLKIVNTGKMNAENLHLQIDKDYYPPQENQEHEQNLKDSYIFKEPIRTLCPSQEIIFYLGLGKKIFEEENNRRPRIFTITATYEYLGLSKTLCEKNIIDLNIYQGSQLFPQEPIVTQLKELVEGVKEIAKLKNG